MTKTASRFFDFPYFQLRSKSQSLLFNFKNIAQWVEIFTPKYLALTIGISLLRKGLKPKVKKEVVDTKKRIPRTKIKKIKTYFSFQSFIKNEKLMPYNQTEINQINKKFGLWKEINNFELMPLFKVKHAAIKHPSTFN